MGCSIDVYGAQYYNLWGAASIDVYGAQYRCLWNAVSMDWVEIMENNYLHRSLEIFIDYMKIYCSFAADNHLSKYCLGKTLISFIDVDNADD